MPGNRVIAPDLIEDLPPSVAVILEEFVATLLQSTGSRLDAVILFGSAAEGRLRSTSDVNLLVIADGLTLPELAAV